MLIVALAVFNSSSMNSISTNPFDDDEHEEFVEGQSQVQMTSSSQKPARKKKRRAPPPPVQTQNKSVSNIISFFFQKDFQMPIALTLVSHFTSCSKSE
jgi:hypothetical protein